MIFFIAVEEKDMSDTPIRTNEPTTEDLIDPDDRVDDLAPPAKKPGLLSRVPKPSVLVTGLSKDYFAAAYLALAVIAIVALFVLCQEYSHTTRAASWPKMARHGWLAAILVTVAIIMLASSAAVATQLAKSNGAKWLLMATFVVTLAMFVFAAYFFFSKNDSGTAFYLIGSSVLAGLVHLVVMFSEGVEFAAVGLIPWVIVLVFYLYMTYKYSFKCSSRQMVQTVDQYCEDLDDEDVDQQTMTTHCQTSYDSRGC